MCDAHYACVYIYVCVCVCVCNVYIYTVYYTVMYITCTRSIY